MKLKSIFNMRKNNNYLGIISRSDLNALYRNGYMKLSIQHFHVFTDMALSEDVIVQLLDSVSPITYTSEVLFIHICKSKLRKTKIEKIEWKDVKALIPLDWVAKQDLNQSFHKKVKFEEPKWADYVEDFMQQLFCENMRRGAKACLEIFDIGRCDSLCESYQMEDPDLIMKFTNCLFAKETLDEQSSIWQYLLKYERHEPYPKSLIGYFYDSIHVFTNFTVKKELLDLSQCKSRILNILNEIEEKEFDKIVDVIESNDGAQKYIEKCHTKERKDYIVMPLYFFLFSILTLENGIAIDKGFLEVTKLKSKYRKEFEYAAYLVGIRLGFTAISDLYYEHRKQILEIQGSLF